MRKSSRMAPKEKQTIEIEKTDRDPLLSFNQAVTVDCSDFLGTALIFAEGIKRRFHFEEHLSVCHLGTTRLQVVDQGLADLVGQRQSQRRARLRLLDFYGRLRPTKVVQFQCTNIPSAQLQPA